MVNVDTKLLVIFTELLSKRNATYVAEKMHMTAPAVSHSLGRLREIFDDPLFIRVPHGLTPTPRALELGPKIRDMLDLWSSINEGDADNFDPAIGWSDLDFIRQHWKGPILLKGILDAEDAREAAARGVEGVIVSNHGGRQLDGVPSSARALPAIADAVGDRLTLMADGGIRSGLDVVRMLALGAKGVLLGRAWAWALGGAGQAGVAHVLQLLAAEMRVAMGLTGVTRIKQINEKILAGGE